MFKFLKDKLKSALGKFSKKVEEEVEVEEKTVEVKEEPKQKPPEKKTIPKARGKEAPILKKAPEKAPEIREAPAPLQQPEVKEELLLEEIKEEEQAAEEKLAEAKKAVKEEGEAVEEEEREEERVEAEEKEGEKKSYDIWYGKEEEKRGFLKRLFGRKKPKEEKRKKPEEKPAIIERELEGQKAKEEKPAVFEIKAKKETETTVAEITPPPETVEEAAEEDREREIKEAEERIGKRRAEAEELEEAEAEEEALTEEAAPEEPAEKPSFIKKITERLTKFSLSEEKFEEIFWELEVALMENNVAVEVIAKIKEDLKEQLTKNKISRKNVEDMIMDTLKKSIEDLFKVEQIDLIKEARKKKPYVIAFIGVNGSGKTTTLAKVAKLFLDNKLIPVIAASDTFRAAAIQQLEEHAVKLGVKLIRQDYKADPAAVAFDAIEHAKAKNLDVVLIDTAGRLHSNDNLMNELKKLIRVNKPDLKIFVGESITGNDCVEQCKLFDEAVGIDGIILAKADVDEKGGAAVSVSYVTGKPIIYIGTGQKYEDLKKFESRIVVENLGL